jgi:hypothetical protein
MSWEILALAGAILVIAGVAVIAMRKTRSEFTTFGPSRTNPPVDVQALAQAIAKAVGVELREILKELPPATLPRGQRYPAGYIPGGITELDNIEMDESIIPMKIETKVQATNLDKLGKEEKKVDKGLDESKSKLAGLLKNRSK